MLVHFELQINKASKSKRSKQGKRMAAAEEGAM
jgi:hypothetical protein